MRNQSEMLMDVLIEMSRYAGERYDLIQAGGGNASVKTEAGRMLIKASGFRMGDVRPDSGISEVHYDLLIDIMAEFTQTERLDKKDVENFTATALARVTKAGSPRPSIETFMHAALGKCVLHAHPLTAVAVTSRKGWRDVLSEIFPDSLLVGYHTPGIELACAVVSEIEKRGIDANEDQLVIFLANHGVIVSGSDGMKVLETTNSVAVELESVSGIATEQFRTTTEISAYVNTVADTRHICREATDACLLDVASSRPELLFEPPFCPDKVVYNGFEPLSVESLDDPDALKAYVEKHGEIPRIIIFRGRIFFIAPDVQSVCDVEDILKYHLLVLSGKGREVNSLKEDEIKYLGGWEAEKHRRGS